MLQSVFILGWLNDRQYDSIKISSIIMIGTPHCRELLPCSRMVAIVSPLLYQGILDAVATDNTDRFASLWRSLCRNEQIHHKELIAFPCNLL